MPEAEKRELKKLGIRSAEDLRRTIEEQNVDIAKVTDNKVDYQGLADLLNQTERKKMAPEVHSASLSKDEDKTVLTLTGNNCGFRKLWPRKGGIIPEIMTADFIERDR